MKDLLTKELHGLSIIKINEKEDRFNSSDSFFSKSEDDNNIFTKDIMLTEISPSKHIKHKCTNVNPKYNTTHKKTLSSRLTSNHFAFKLNFNNATCNKNNNNINKLLTNESDGLIRKLQRKYNDKLQKVQESFVIELDKLYKDNFDKIEEINNKYNIDYYKQNNIEDDKNKSRQILNDKENELNEVENEFIIKKNCSLMNYNEQINTFQINIDKYNFKFYDIQKKVFTINKIHIRTNQVGNNYRENCGDALVDSNNHLKQNYFVSLAVVKRTKK